MLHQAGRNIQCGNVNVIVGLFATAIKTTCCLGEQKVAVAVKVMVAGKVTRTTHTDSIKVDCIEFGKE